MAARRVAYAPAVATGCFISTGRSLEEAIERVKLAESLGYESVYVTHIAGRESLTVITAYALANCTQNPRLVFRKSRMAEPLSRLPTWVS